MFGPNSLISNKLKSSLGSKQKNVSEKITSSAKRSQLEKAEIKFIKAESDVNQMLESLKNKYICLNRGSLQIAQDTEKKKKNKLSAGEDDGIPRPSRRLFDPEELNMAWPRIGRIGPGLQNLGNTCFLNSVLQCLTYTVPFSTYLTSGEHKKQCKIVGFCMLCELQYHASRCLKQSNDIIKPMNILQKLKLIARHMRWGRQEDAHEFLRYVVDSMQKASLSVLPGGPGADRLKSMLSTTTFAHSVFGGYLRSQVRCLQCKMPSDTYDPVLDLSVDLEGAKTVEKALQRFVAPEILDGGNAYTCARCKKKVRAVKQFTIHRSPKILTLHLKRFDHNRMFGGKVNRHIQFPQKLDLRPYMSRKKGDPIDYHLYAVLVHSGHSCNSGHYYSFVKGSSQTWYCMNDCSVTAAGLNQVLSAEAYILFYSQIVRPKPSKTVSTAPNGSAKNMAEFETKPSTSTSINRLIKTTQDPKQLSKTEANQSTVKGTSGPNKPKIPSLIATPSKHKRSLSDTTSLGKRESEDTISECHRLLGKETSIKPAPESLRKTQPSTGLSESPKQAQLSAVAATSITNAVEPSKKSDESSDNLSTKSSPKKLKKKKKLAAANGSVTLNGNTEAVTPIKKKLKKKLKSLEGSTLSQSTTSQTQDSQGEDQNTLKKKKKKLKRVKSVDSAAPTALLPDVDTTAVHKFMPGVESHNGGQPGLGKKKKKVKKVKSLDDANMSPTPQAEVPTINHNSTSAEQSARSKKKKKLKRRESTVVPEAVVPEPVVPKASTPLTARLTKNTRIEDIETPTKKRKLDRVNAELSRKETESAPVCVSKSQSDIKKAPKKPPKQEENEFSPPPTTPMQMPKNGSHKPLDVAPYGKVQNKSGKPSVVLSTSYNWRVERNGRQRHSSDSSTASVSSTSSWTVTALNPPYGKLTNGHIVNGKLSKAGLSTGTASKLNNGPNPTNGKLISAHGVATDGNNHMTNGWKVPDSPSLSDASNSSSTENHVNMKLRKVNGSTNLKSGDSPLSPIKANKKQGLTNGNKRRPYPSDSSEDDKHSNTLMPSPPLKRLKPKPSVVSWDASLRTTRYCVGYKSDDVETKPTGGLGWDGTVRQNVREQMARCNDDTKVMTWDGAASELMKPTTATKKFSWYNDYEQEIDEGKKKKSKIPKEKLNHRDFFSSLQQKNNEQKELYRQGKLSHID